MPLDFARGFAKSSLSPKEQRLREQQREREKAREKSAVSKSQPKQDIKAKEKEKSDREKQKSLKEKEQKLQREKELQKEKLAKEKAAKDKVAKEKAAKEKAAREKAAKEKAAREKASTDKAVKEKAAKDAAAKEKAAKNKEQKRLQLQKEKEKHKAQKEKARLLATKEKEKEKALKEKEKEKKKQELAKQKEKVVKKLASKPIPPKRTRGPYTFFISEQMPKLLKEFPDKAVSERMVLVAERWKELTDEKKKPFIALSEQDKERRATELEAYKKTLPPKRPLSAYLLFANSIRPQIQKENPEAEVQEILRLTGEKWGTLSANQKQPFQQQAEQLRGEYYKEKAKFDEKAKQV